MKLVSQAQMREIDRRSIAGGVSGLELMERAGRGILRSLLRRVPDLGPSTPVWILCGRGNNGGDGLVLARLLRERGLWPRVFLVCDPAELSGDAGAQVSRARRAGLRLERPDARDWDRLLRVGREGVVVDALLGTGTSGPPRGTIAEWIGLLDGCRARILAVDIPSGLSGDDATGTSPAIRADWTVTLGFPKRSFPFPPLGPRLGPVDLVDLGFPEEIVRAVGWDAEIPEPEELRSWLPDGATRDHKGLWGRLLVLGGSPGLSGAPILAARAGLRTGAGLIRVGVPAGLVPVVDTAILEAMSIALPEGEDGQLLARSAEEILAHFGNWDALVLGPGLGRFPETERLVLKLLGAWRGPLLLDADALHALAAWGADSWVPRAREMRAGGAPGGLVLTPHVGEMARLIGKPKEEWAADAIRTAREWAGRWGTTLVLKGAPSVVAAPDGRVWVNPSGHSGLATGGSGDVLSGIIGALLAQGLDGPRAAVLGSYLHGRAAELGTRGARRSLLPSDVVEALPFAIEATERLRPWEELPIARI